MNFDSNKIILNKTHYTFSLGFINEKAYATLPPNPAKVLEITPESTGASNTNDITKISTTHYTYVYKD